MEEYFSNDFVKKTLKKCEGESFVAAAGGGHVVVFGGSRSGPLL